MRFCGEDALDGGPALRCTSCGYESDEGLRFCGACGARLPRPTAPTRLPEADRRQITVLFCDLAESTLLSARLDPEELHYVVRRYQAACADSIEHYGGHVAQYLGDGLLVYFGWPVAHEDDPRRAVHAALGIVAAVEELGQRIARELGVELAVRLGLHTGPVVAGEVGAGARRERLALGLTPNVAAHVQVYAEPNTVVLSRATYELVRDYFDCEPLGTRLMKGLAAPIELFRAVRTTGERSRFARSLRRGLSPAVGRQRESDFLRERFEHAREGRGQVVLVHGEAGIGKSRLLHRLRERVRDERPLWLACGCDEIATASPFGPLLDLSHELFGFVPGEPGEERLKKLEAVLAPFGALAESVPLFSEILSVPLGAAYERPVLAPPLLRQRAIEKFVGILLSLARQQPVVFVMEDVHWADPSSLEFLRTLVERIDGGRLLVLLTHRPGFTPAWPAPPHQTTLALERLAPADVEQMIDALVPDRTVPEPMRRQIALRAEGVPLFVEEFTRMVTESPAGAGAASSAIPDTLQELLTSRLDRLGSAKTIAHVAGLIGREFRYDLVRAVVTVDDEHLRRDLELLVEADLLSSHGSPPHETYEFKHALLQHAAVASLLRGQREEGHHRIAEALLARFAEVAERQPERVAHHFTEAGRVEPAVAHWLKAGTRALARSANLEALAHLGRGLALVEAAPETSWRRIQELALRSALGRAHSAVRGYAAPEVEQAYSRARELCRGAGETLELFWTLWGLHTYYAMRAELPTADELGVRMRRIGETLGSSALLTTAHYGLGVVTFFRGDAATALQHCETARRHDPVGRTEPHASAAYTVMDTGVVVRTLAGIVLAYRGEPAAALASGGEALALAERLEHPYSHACALNENAWIRLMLRDAPATLALAEQAIAVCDARGFLLWSVVDHFVAGWAEANGASGAPLKSGVERMRQNLATYRAFGCRLSLPNWISLFAEACVRHGLAQDARAALAEARAAAAASGEHGYDAEIERIAGELALASGGADGRRTAEAQLRRALALARANGAGGPELRAAVRLARLLGESSRRGEAAEALAPVLGRLGSGGPWPELHEARALLESLA